MEAAASVDLEGVAAEQAEVVSRQQLHTLGVTRHDVRSQVRARRWRLVGRAVVLHRGPLTREARWWVAVVHAGSGALLCAWSAAEYWGLAGFDRETVHVVVPHGARVRALPWMRVHVSRRLRAEDRHPGRRLPVVRVERALLDAAVWSTRSRAGAALAVSGVQQGLVQAGVLVRALGEAGQVRHRRVLAAALLDAAGGADSLAEIDLGRLSRTYGLPQPYRRQRRTDSRGRRRYLDGWYRRADGRVVHLEVDGGVHLDTVRWWDDMDRQTDLAIAEDALVVRLAAAALRIDEADCARRLARALGVTPTW